MQTTKQNAIWVFLFINQVEPQPRSEASLPGPGSLWVCLSRVGFSLNLLSDKKLPLDRWPHYGIPYRQYHQYPPMDQ